VRVLVITGTGRGFCSGGDVHDIIGRLVEMDDDGLLAFTRMTGAVVQRMRELPVPIIASVNGIAAGAGAVIALAADLRLVARSASFAFLFTKVGLAGADMGCAYLLPRIVGMGRAVELLLSGRSVGPAEAERIGLATHVVEDDELAGETASLAARLAAGPAMAFAATKRLLEEEQHLDLASAIELEAVTQAGLMQTADFREFYAAFNEGREPTWTGT
jgi:enoyl-CoA hydratase/carnithine racemase